MRKVATTVGLLLLMILAPTHLLFGCSWATGYFHQVTVLKGKVAGRNLQRFGPLGYVRWLRQRPVDAAQLKLYDYVWPLKDNNQLKEVASVKSDASGDFDFGVSVPEGHYFLEIIGSDLSDWYEVEITKKAKSTKRVTIDISPNYP